MGFKVNVHKLRHGSKEFAALFDEGSTAADYVNDHVKVDGDVLGRLFYDVAMEVRHLAEALVPKMRTLDATALSYSLELGQVANYYEVTDTDVERRMDAKLPVSNSIDYYLNRHTPRDTVPYDHGDD